VVGRGGRKGGQGNVPHKPLAAESELIYSQTYTPLWL